MKQYIQAVEALNVYEASELNDEKIDAVLCAAVKQAYDNLDVDIKHLIQLSCCASVADIIW